MDDKTFDTKAAQEWLSLVEGHRHRFQKGDIYARLNRWVLGASPTRILEIGCGQGICSEAIEPAGIEYTGVEPSPYLLDRASERYARPNWQFVPGNAYKLPFSDQHFDAVFAVRVWHLLSDCRKAALELHRVLTPGGKFLIITANPGARAAWQDSYSEARSDGPRLEGTMRVDGQAVGQDVIYLHPLEELLQSLHTAGLQVRQTETFRASEKFQGQYLWLAIEGEKPFGSKATQRPTNPG